MKEKFGNLYQEYLKNHPQSTGKVGCTGFSLIPIQNMPSTTIPTLNGTMRRPLSWHGSGQ
ncbi:MAG: hypothetical protein M0Q53_08955 [Prolixibacteraceae bacterium]|jgi:hypothetical protein|nr:hypothetical protein [Prolixibacteraceae bacterium]